MIAAEGRSFSPAAMHQLRAAPIAIASKIRAWGLDRSRPGVLRDVGAHGWLREHTNLWFVRIDGGYFSLSRSSDEKASRTKNIRTKIF